MPVPVLATNDVVGRVDGVTVSHGTYGSELHARGWLDLSELFRIFPDYEDSLLPKGMGPNSPDIPLIGCGISVLGGDIRDGGDSPDRLFAITGPWTLRYLQVYDVGSPVVWPGVGLRLEEITMDGEL
jgi:hypothetical protein